MWNANSEGISFSGFNLNSVSVLSCLDCQRMGTISAGMSCYHQPWAQWLLTSHWLMPCHQSLWLVRVGLWGWGDICDVDMRYVRSVLHKYTSCGNKTRQTLRSEARTDNILYSSSILVMRYIFIIWIWNIFMYARGVIVDWSIVEIDNWFTLFAWLGLVSVLIKITIRNSVLIISYCENIITGTLIWIITGLDSWDSDSVAIMSVSVSCGGGIQRGPGSASCFRSGWNYTTLSSHSMAEWGEGGKKIRITIQMKLEMPSFDPHLPSTLDRWGQSVSLS